jgi:hypothetical protein
MTQSSQMGGGGWCEGGKKRASQSARLLSQLVVFERARFIWSYFCGSAKVNCKGCASYFWTFFIRTEIITQCGMRDKRFKNLLIP